MTKSGPNLSSTHFIRQLTYPPPYPSSPFNKVPLCQFIRNFTKLSLSVSLSLSLSHVRNVVSRVRSMPNNTVTCVTAANNLTLLSVGLHITDTGAHGNEPNLHAQCITLYFREFSFRENLSRSLPCHSVSSDYGWRQWPLSGVAPDTVIIIIIIRQEFDLERPVLALSKVFQVVFVHLVYNIVLFLALLLFIIVTRRSQFDLYLLGISSAGSTFKSSKISSFLMWSKMVYPVVLMKKKNFISTDVKRFLFFYPGVQISLP